MQWCPITVTTEPLTRSYVRAVVTCAGELATELRAITGSADLSQRSPVGERRGSLLAIGKRPRASRWAGGCQSGKRVSGADRRFLARGNSRVCAWQWPVRRGCVRGRPLAQCGAIIDNRLVAKRP